MSSTAETPTVFKTLISSLARWCAFCACLAALTYAAAISGCSTVHGLAKDIRQGSGWVERVSAKAAAGGELPPAQVGIQPQQRRPSTDAADAPTIDDRQSASQRTGEPPIQPAQAQGSEATHSAEGAAHSPLVTDAFLDGLAWVESDGDPEAVGDGGRARGPLQIHRVYMMDVNRILGCEAFIDPDRLDPAASRAMARIYLTYWSGYWQRRGCQLAEEDLLAMHRSGGPHWTPAAKCRPLDRARSRKYRAFLRSADREGGTL